MLKIQKKPAVKINDRVYPDGAYVRGQATELINRGLLKQHKLCQTKTSMTAPLLKFLSLFYSNSLGNTKCFSFINKRKEYNIEENIEIENKYFEEAVNKIMYFLKYIPHGTFSGTQNKYRNKSLEKMTQNTLTFSYIDNMGNKKVQEESPLTIYKYFLDIVKKTHNIKKQKGFMNQSIYDTNPPNISESELLATNNYTLHITTDIQTKMEAVKMNPSFGSCQVSKNCSRGNLSEGLYDFFTDGALVAIIVKDSEGKIVGRSAGRLYYTPDKKEYYLFERFYTYGNLSNEKKMASARIIDKLVQHFDNVIIGPHVADYVDSSYKKHRMTADELFNLRGPVKNIIPEFYNQSYYQDAGGFLVRASKTKGYNKPNPQQTYYLVKKSS